MKSFLKGFLKAIFVIVIICIVGFVIIAVVVLRAPNKAINKLEDKIVEIEENKEEISEEVSEKESGKEEVEVSQDDIRPEFKKSMEDYEAFFDEYVNIMNSYAKDPTNLSLLGKYTDMLSKYEKYMFDFEAIDESKLTKAEYKLFIDTQLRISNKLTQVAIDLS